MKKIIVALLFLLPVVSLHAQKPLYKIYVISFAHSGYKFTEADWAMKAPKSKPVDIKFMFWLIAGNGHHILVDAGFLNDIPDAKDFKLSTYKSPDVALSPLGLKASAITDIIISHPHWDHIDGISLFPNAHIWMQKDDYNGLVNNWKLKKLEGGFAKRDADKISTLYKTGKVTLIAGDKRDILKGIDVFTGSKHTFNSQYVLVKQVIHPTVIASDNLWIYYSLEHLSPPAAGGTIDPQGYVAEIKRMKTLAYNNNYILPGHDGAVFSRFKKIAADGSIIEVK